MDGQTVTTTALHPFFVQGQGWTAVRDLQPGDQLDQPDGTTVAVQAVVATGRTGTTYNFEVESNHDYYVGVGVGWVLVHNDCSSRPRDRHHGGSGIGTLAGVALSAADATVIQRLVNGWKPHQFVEGYLQPLVSHSAVTSPQTSSNQERPPTEG